MLEISEKYGSSSQRICSDEKGTQTEVADEATKITQIAEGPSVVTNNCINRTETGNL
jgi:hypothetical protein